MWFIDNLKMIDQDPYATDEDTNQGIDPFYVENDYDSDVSTEFGNDD
jgi:hypothetical protein